MTGRQLLAGLFGGGLAVSLWIFISGLRDAGVGNETEAPRFARMFDGLSFRRLARQRHRIAGCTAGTVSLTLWTGWPTMIPIGFAACWFLPRLLGPDRESRAQADLSEAVATFAEMLRDTLTVAAGLQQAVLAVCPLAPAPIAAACRRLVEAVESGTPMAMAIAGWADDVADRDADNVAAALIIAVKKQSGNTAAVLGTMAATARDYAAIRRQATADQAKVRTSARIVIGTIIGLITLLIVADGTYMQPYDTALGQLVLLVAASLFGLGLAWMNRIMHPAPAPRILTGLQRLASQSEEVRTW